MISACASVPAGEAQTAVPFEVLDGLFDHSRPDDLGLETLSNAETVTIFSPGDGDNAFNHGVVLMPFKGRLYAQWQTSARDEDAPDTHVVYSSSDDGRNWSDPVVLAPAWEEGIRTSGGWWSDGRTLVGYINVWPDPGDGPKGGYTEYKTSRNGLEWSESRRVLAADGSPVEGIFEQDPHDLPDGRIISAFHMQPGLIVSPWFTDDPLGVTGWQKGALPNLPHDNPGISREIEPSWYRRGDGAVVMVFRDQQASFRKLAAASHDRGLTWRRPVLTAMPDARTKQSAGNLPDGTAYLVGNPVSNRNRFPLVVTLSSDGWLFDRAFLLRAGGADLPPLRYPGKYKRPGYSYAKCVLWAGGLYVAYATNKEDVQLTRVPVAEILTNWR